MSSSSIEIVPCRIDGIDNCEIVNLHEERDGQTYKTIKMGRQIWRAENLNYAYLQPMALEIEYFLGNGGYPSNIWFAQEVNGMDAYRDAFQPLSDSRTDDNLIGERSKKTASAVRCVKDIPD